MSVSYGPGPLQQSDTPPVDSGPIDNGPYVDPAPPGPRPTGIYEYVVIPRQVPPLDPIAPFYAVMSAPIVQVEREFAQRRVWADRIDLIDGSRCYRVLLQYLWQLDSDARGPFIGRPPLTQYRFQLNDPTLTTLPTNEWLPAL